MPDQTDTRRGDLSSGLRYFLAIYLIALLTSCSDSAAAPPETKTQPRAAMTVTVEPVGEATLTEELALTGTIEAWQTLTISSELSGVKLTAVVAEIGDEVRVGEPLAYLDDRSLRAQLEAARARHRRAVANVSRMRRPDRPQQINSLRAAVEQSRASVAQEEANLSQLKINQASAARTAQRYNKALEEGYVTALEADQRITDKNSQLAAIRAAEQRIQGAKFSLRQAEENLRMAQAGGRVEDVRMAEAERDEALASITQLEVQLEQCVIRAPDSGTILTQSAYLGDITTLGQELFTIARESRLQLWAEVPQHQLERLVIGAPVELRSEGNVEQGKVEEIDPKINSTTRQGRVRIGLAENTDFRIGEFARASFKGADSKALVVTSEAVQGQSGEEFVFVLQEGKAMKRSIALGRRQGANVEVLSGLNNDEKVVVSGAAFLADGDSVKVGNS